MKKVPAAVAFEGADGLAETFEEVVGEDGASAEEVCHIDTPEGQERLSEVKKDSRNPAIVIRHKNNLLL